MVRLHILFFSSLCFGYVNSWTSSGYYIDNGVDQTERVNEISPRSKRELQQEILTILGLHHRPKPKRHSNGYSAPRFMLDLYNTITGVDGILLDSDDTPSFHLTSNISIGNIIEPIQGADVIMSFVNNGKILSIGQVIQHVYTYGTQSNHINFTLTSLVTITKQCLGID